jgi:hypothetical protein
VEVVADLGERVPGSFPLKVPQLVYAAALRRGALPRPGHRGSRSLLEETLGRILAGISGRAA